MNELVFGWRTAIMTVMVLQLLVFTGLLLARSVEPIADRLMAALFVVIIGVLCQQLIGFAGFYDAYPWLSFAPLNNAMFIGPLIAAYVYRLTVGPLKRWWIWPFLPGALVLVYRTVLFAQPLDRKEAWAETVHRPYLLEPFSKLEVMIAIGGLIYAAFLLRRYRIWLSENSSVKAEYDLTGLGWVLGLIGLATLGPLIVVTAESVFGRLNYVQAFPSHILIGASMTALGLLVLLQPRRPFPKVISQPEHTDAGITTDRNWSEIGQMVEQSIREGKWYREPRFSLADAATKLSMPERVVSSAINNGLDTTFNGLINRLRVEAVAHELEHSQIDLLSIAFEAGFNSKSSFNRAFRDHMGITPTAYRRRLSTQKPENL